MAVTANKYSYIKVGGVVYRLNGKVMEQVDDNQRLAKWGRFMAKAEMHEVLALLYTQNRTEASAVYYTAFGRHPVTARKHTDGTFSIGCHNFKAPVVRKLARWAGLPLKTVGKAVV